MAKIIENGQGRRMIRLSPEDILTVVTQYQQQALAISNPPRFQELKSHLETFPLYLPEEL